MGCMNHISPSENMFKTAPGAKFRGVEKLAWDSWRILMPFRVFSSRHVFIRCLYITYTAGENNVLSRHHARKHNYIYNTTRVAQVLRWLNLEGRRGSRGRNPPVDHIYVLKYCLNNSVSSDRSHQVCQKDRTTRNLSYLDFDCLRWCLVLSNFSARKGWPPETTRNNHRMLSPQS